jgi:hypothetical protein
MDYQTPKHKLMMASQKAKEQIKHYEDIISEIEYDRKDALALDQTLYQIRKDMGEGDENLNLGIIEASK